ncbi:energy-coupling factor transport system ATP-binding protein [Microlunatus flavus]|uniref:Energy-coupling factor transport system ATP-binding protein n=2 Tax=Microlunatus flavus TaxID=1036181 RepID=A0A1H9NAC8_9ACTN|nr:energy-coupling factor transport system ATP-binding protein [Microlunatus flavus]
MAVGALEASGLTWRPYARATPTLVDVGLRFAPGERVLLAGASGSGKSTLLRGLAGLLDDSEGELVGQVTLGGRDPQERPGAVGLLLQDPRAGVVAEHVGRDVAFGPENRSQPPATIRSRVVDALGAVAFPYGAERPTAALSGGEGARLALAGALALGPEVLLLDEPTAMLDAAAATRVVAAVREAADAAGVTLVVAEHQLGPWLDVCDRLVVLDGGRVLADGAVRDVLSARAPALLAAGVWVPGAPDPEPLALALPDRGRAAAGLRWRGLRVAAPDGHALVEDAAGELAAGESLAVVGPSGAGKSTLLRVLAGLERPAAGTADLRTEDGWTPLPTVAASSPVLARHVGWAPQDSESAFTARTVLEEVRATGEVLHAGDPERLAASRARADLLVEALGLTALRDENPYAVSGGEQRRVVLAAATAHDPAVVLLDEPTVGQDRQTWAAVAGVLDAVQRSGSAVVATTHDPRLAARLGTRLALDGHAPTALEPADHHVRPVHEPGLPPAGRCNPLALLGTAVLAGVGSFAVTDALVGLLTLTVTLLLSPFAVRRVRPVLLRLAPVGLAALSVGWSTLLLNAGGAFSPGSGALAAKEVTRILCLVVPGALLVGLLRPSTLADALGQRLRLPARPVVTASAGLLRLDDFARSWRAMAQVRHVRGLAPRRSPVARVRQAASLTLGLLVHALRAAQELSVAMDARGFAAVRRRTYALPSTFGRADAVCLLVGVLLLVLPWTLGTVLGAR